MYDFFPLHFHDFWFSSNFLINSLVSQKGEDNDNGLREELKTAQVIIV